MKSWESKNLGEVCLLINRGISPKYLEKGGILVLNQKCVREHSVNFSLGRRHDINAKKVKDERIIIQGDVLVNSTGTGTLGRVAQVRFIPPEITTVDSHVTIVRPKYEIFNLDFFGYLMIGLEEKLKKAGEGASGQTELSRKTIADDFIISYPSSKLVQAEIAEKLDTAFDEITKSEAILKKQQSLLSELRQTLLFESLNSTQ